MQIAIAGTKIELVDKLIIFHDIQSVKDIELLLFGNDQRVHHQILKRDGLRNIVE